MSSIVDVNALLSVVVAGVVLGAGIPALFAVGVKTLTLPAGSTELALSRKVAAGLCFGICALAILGGVVFLAYGGHA